jgi:tetratricopeptide (TPR) repeat protein
MTTKRSSELNGFVGSLILLVGALGLFFVMLFLVPKRQMVAPIADSPVATVVTETKRQAMRQVRAPESASEIVESGSDDTHPPAEIGPDGKMIVSESASGEAVDPEVQSAITLIDNGNVTEAIAKLEAILKKDPKNEQALVELAMVNLLDLKQPDQAIGYLQRVMEVNPRNQVVMSELVSLYEEEGRIEEGLNFLMDLQNQDQATPDLAYGIGQMLAMQGRDGEAIGYLEKATQAGDYQVRAYRDLAEAYNRSGDLNRALEAYDKAIGSQEREIADKTARGLPVTFAEERLNYTKMEKARALLNRDDLDGAQALMDEIMQAMPDDKSVMALQEQILSKRRG